MVAELAADLALEAQGAGERVDVAVLLGLRAGLLDELQRRLQHAARLADADDAQPLPRGRAGPPAADELSAATSRASRARCQSPRSSSTPARCCSASIRSDDARAGRSASADHASCAACRLPACSAARAGSAASSSCSRAASRSRRREPALRERQGVACGVHRERLARSGGEGRRGLVGAACREPLLGHGDGRRAARRERRRRALVQHPAARPGHVGEHRLAHERVPEGRLAGRRPRRAGPASRAASTAASPARSAASPGRSGRRAPPPAPARRAPGRRDAGQAAQDGLAQGLRQRRVRVGAGRDGRRQLEHGERHAAGARVQAGGDGVVRRPSQDAARERPRGGGVERLQLELAQRAGPAQGARAPTAAGAGGAGPRSGRPRARAAAGRRSPRPARAAARTVAWSPHCRSSRRAPPASPSPATRTPRGRPRRACRDRSPSAASPSSGSRRARCGASGPGRRSTRASALRAARRAATSGPYGGEPVAGAARADREQRRAGQDVVDQRGLAHAGRPGDEHEAPEPAAARAAASGELRARRVAADEPRRCHRPRLRGSDGPGGLGYGDVHLLPRGRVRADQQLRRHRGRAPAPRPSRRLRGRGVVRRHARGEGVRGAPDAARPEAGGGGGAGPVLEGLHPRDGAGLPQADDRAAGGLHRADVAGAAGRRALRRRAPRGDLRRGAAGRHLRGQRPLLPGHPRQRPPVGAHPLLQPARGEGSRPAADVLRLRRGRPRAAGTPSATSTAAPTARCTRRSTRSSGSAARRRCPTWSSSTSRRGSTSTSTPPRPTTRARSRSRRRGTAWSRACAGPTTRSSCPTSSPAGAAASSTSASARWARRTST